jgi:hypothetical protein
MLARSSGMAWHGAEIPPILCNIHSAGDVDASRFFPSSSHHAFYHPSMFILRSSPLSDIVSLVLLVSSDQLTKYIADE